MKEPAELKDEVHLTMREDLWLFFAQTGVRLRYAATSVADGKDVDRLAGPVEPVLYIGILNLDAHESVAV